MSTGDHVCLRLLRLKFAESTNWPKCFKNHSQGSEPKIDVGPLQVERLRKELSLLQRYAAGAVRHASATTAEDDIAALVAENEDLRCRLRQSEGDCELAMCELEAALEQVDALEPHELRGHEAEILAARCALSRRRPSFPLAAPHASVSPPPAVPDAPGSAAASPGSAAASVASQWLDGVDLVAPPREENWTA